MSNETKTAYMNDLLQPMAYGVFYKTLDGREQFRVFDVHQKGERDACLAFIAACDGSQRPEARPILRLDDHYDAAKRDKLMHAGRLIGHDGKHWYAECKKVRRIADGIYEG